MNWIRRIIRALSSVAVVGVLAWGAWWVLTDPRSPLPPEWHPFTPLDVAAPVTWLTPVKLDRALRDERACLAALTPVSRVQSLPPRVETETCGIDPRVDLRGVGDAALRPIETTCAVALRLAMWERHSVQPTAQRLFGQGIARLDHQGSYNCRPIRGGTRMSTHATAQAIDIRGVVLEDGRTIPLLGNYDGDTPEAQFYRDLRDGACDWFVTVLGPEFNALHADHFHMQSVGWGSCR